MQSRLYPQMENWWEHAKNYDRTLDKENEKNIVLCSTYSWSSNNVEQNE